MYLRQNNTEVRPLQTDESRQLIDKKGCGAAVGMSGVRYIATMN